MSELPLVSPLDRVLFLRTRPDFVELDPAVLVAIANHTEERSYREGEEIFGETDSDRHVHFLVEGTVRTTVVGETSFDVSSPGGVGLMRELARSAEPGGAIALTEVVSLRIEIESFLQVMEDHFHLVLGLIRSFTDLISGAEEQLEIAPGGIVCVDCSEPDSDVSLDLVQKLSRARRAPLFQSANLTMLTELLRGIPESYVERDEWLFRAGQLPDTLHLVFEGAVRIENPSKTRVAYAGPGDLIALSDFCRDEPHSFGAVTETPVQLLRIDKSHYIDVLEDHFDHALDLLALLAQRHIELRSRLQTLSSD
ncbi:MAG: cyclic nucleotide-binding domain-containing protein [Deltaproteobacteria bacterium]|nr:cyclic nucleotide-binding domain-containing protein [Deltaproteobacteria bacterium]MBW2726746.1 cyclic nucleotide-binding domain-containing protein [Deltaproteobacteria bacterium]